jgi:hypothetical protein
VPWTVEGQEALRLEDVDAVLYLCVHALLKHHAHLGLRPVSDLVYVVRDWSPERWQALVSRAVAYCLSRPVYLMLVLMEELFGLAPPREVSAALRPPGGDALPGDLVERLLVRNGTQAVVVPRAAVQAGAKGGTAAGLRHFLWHTFLPREGMAHKYGIPAASPRIWLTYLWRPIDLLRRYGDSAWKSLRRDETVRAAWDGEAWLEQWLHGVGSGE